MIAAHFPARFFAVTSENRNFGPVLYLNGGNDLSAPLARAEAAGGTVVLPKTPIGQNGFMALFIDTEGNKIGLHSMN